MNETIGVERLYTLGNYKNIKLTDTISDIPEELMFNNDFHNIVRTLQFIRLDKQFLSYRNTTNKLVSKVLGKELDINDAIEILNANETDTITSLEEIINGKKEEAKKDK